MSPAVGGSEFVVVPPLWSEGHMPRFVFRNSLAKFANDDAIPGR